MVMLLAGRAEVVGSIPLSDHSNNKIVYVFSARSLKTPLPGDIIEYVLYYDWNYIMQRLYQTTMRLNHPRHCSVI